MNMAASKSDDVPQEVMDLLGIALFNGYGTAITALAANGALTDEQVAHIHRAMAAPLDDPTFCDDEAMVYLRESLDGAFAAASLAARTGLIEDDEDS